MIGFVSAVVTLLLVAGSAAAQNAFSFVAIGDMPYGERSVVYPKYTALIGAINRAAPAFTIHVGDIKSGSSLCSDEEFANQLAFLNSFASALVYTPGDNEWTDCHRASNGGYDPLERLAKLRAVFFADARSLGAKPMRLERQADVMEGFKPYVENARFVTENVMFVTAHMVGSNNNLDPRNPAATGEFLTRDKANVAWIQESFRAAAAGNRAALVLAIQADPFDLAAPVMRPQLHTGFTAAIAEAFVPLAAAFAKPVLFIHGDSHLFRIDQPFKGAKGEAIMNITRLEVFGAEHMHAVRVGVDPASGSDLWTFQPIYNPAGR